MFGLSLHSTMYLFLPLPDELFPHVHIFTFHNVSISTKCPQDIADFLNQSLHSTMYLFLPVFSPFMVLMSLLYIPQCIYFYSSCGRSAYMRESFTFHNVSISTRDRMRKELSKEALHSTMYLFLPRKSLNLTLEKFFTFHNVSISTLRIWICTVFKKLYIPQCIYFYIGTFSLSSTRHCFTFHNVSISTRWQRNPNRDLMRFTFHNVSISTY